MRRSRVLLALLGSIAVATPAMASDKLPPRTGKTPPPTSPAATSDEPMLLPETPVDTPAPPPARTNPPALSGGAEGAAVNLEGYPFVLFFEWDSAILSAGAAEVLDNVADKYRRTGGQVTISGFADKSGGGGYNRDLSQRRVAVVKAYLASKDIPASAISTEAHGEAKPLIDTADGMREPQNRRVEITVASGSGAVSVR